MTREAAAVRAYRVLVRLFPRPVRERDGEEMVATFAAMLTASRGRSARLGCLVRSFGRLPAVALAEWWDHINAGRWSRRRWRGGLHVDGIRRSFSVELRGLRRAPAFTWSAVLLLGLGVGGVTTVFTLVDHVLLRPLPYPWAERLVEVQKDPSVGAHTGPLWHGVQGFGTVEAWAAAFTENVNLTGVERPERLRAARVTRDFFTVFGARPAAGRLLAGEDFESEQGVVLSAGLWQRAFGSDPGLIGRTIMIDGQPEVVLGVMDPSFTSPEVLVGSRVDLWRTMNWTNPALQSHRVRRLSIAGRLAPGSSQAAAQAEMDALVARLVTEAPTRYVDDEGNPIRLPIASLKDATGARVRQGLGLLFGAVILLLFVACVNVAHLFMARGLARTHEIAIRRALGARMRVLAGQLLVESLLVGLAGAAFGVVLATAGLATFMALIPEALPRADAVHVDLRVLGFAAAVGGLTAIVFGMFPVLRLLSRNAEGFLRGPGRGNSDHRRDARLRTAFVVAEVALSVILVVQAGSLLRAYAHVQRQELGFRTEGIWTLPLELTDLEGPAEWTRRMDAVRGALSAVPGVSMATYGMTMPLEEYTAGGHRCCWFGSPEFLGVPDPGWKTWMHVVDADYFTLLELEFVAGGPWRRGEGRSDPAPAVVSASLATQLYGSPAAAIGRPFTSVPNVPEVDRRFHIVGVVADTRQFGPDQDHGPAAYMPTATNIGINRAHMAVRLDVPSADLSGVLREAVWSVEPDLPVPIVRSLADWANAATAQARFTAAVFTAFGVVALMLVAGGLYGTLLYAIGHKRRELGICLALGELPSRLERRVLGRAVATAAVGCLLGSAGAWAAGRLLANQLEGLESGQLGTLLGAVATLLLVAVAASWPPARRAARTDPLEALKAD